MRSRSSRLLSAVLALALLTAARTVNAQGGAWDDGEVPFVPSPAEVVDRMLRIAQVGKNDYLIDLGSGDGRIVIEAARRGARALGVDIDPTLVERARESARRAGVDARARFEVRDLFETDLSAATVVTLYLLPEFNLRLAPRLLALRPGTRIVSHDWNMGSWRPDEIHELLTPDKAMGADLRSRIFLWVVPASVRGVWTSRLPTRGGEWRFRIEQNYQAIDVDARVQGTEWHVRGARLRGAEIKIAVTGPAGGPGTSFLFDGKVTGDRIDGTVEVSNGEASQTLPWAAVRQR